MIIPFFIPHSGCPHQCVFCNQRNITGRHKSVEVAEVPGRITEYLRTKTSHDPVHVAFYGGSFTALPIETQRSYLEAVQPFIRSGNIRSIRLSTRPDCINTSVLSLLREFHIDTVELGVQSMNDRVLALSGRGHTALDSINAVKQLREFDFKVGLQLMPGLPGDAEQIWRETIDRSVLLKADFVRIYPAIVIKDTPLEKLYEAGKYIPLPLKDAVDQCKSALLAFEKAGIEVIRIGLQHSQELQKPGTIIAGPYHPAFRQFVESSILFDRMQAALSSGNNARNPVFLVHPRDISNAIGQRRSNIGRLEKQFGLERIDIQPDDMIPRRTVKLAVS